MIASDSRSATTLGPSRPSEGMPVNSCVTRIPVIFALFRGHIPSGSHLDPGTGCGSATKWSGKGRVDYRKESTPRICPSGSCSVFHRVGDGYIGFRCFSGWSKAFQVVFRMFWGVTVSLHWRFCRERSRLLLLLIDCVYIQFR